MILKLLADENFPLPVIQGLIDAGCDVFSIAKASPGINDRAVLSITLCALNEVQSGYFAVIQREGIRLRKLKEK